MKFLAFSIRDRLNGFGAITLENNSQAAVRNFSVIFGSGIAKICPSDFDLYKVGTFDTESGHFDSCTPEFVVSGSDAQIMFKEAYGDNA